MENSSKDLTSIYVVVVVSAVEAQEERERTENVLDDIESFGERFKCLVLSSNI